MADVSDVALALAYRCADVLYPSGVGQGSVTGRQTTVRRGWLMPSDMFSAQSLRNSVDYVTVTSMLDGYRVLPEPMGQAWCVDRVLAPTVGVAGVGSVARVSLSAGEVSRGVVGLTWRKGGAPCVCSAYAVTAADTADSIAAGLSAGLPGSTVDGAEIRVSDGELAGYGAGYGRSSRVVRRQSQKFRISIWTASAEARETIGARLDTVLTAANWLSLVDGHGVQMAFEGMGDVDTMQMQALYRRDLVFRITFDTVETQWSAQMMFGGGSLLVGGEVDLFGDVRSTAGVQTDLAVLAAETAAVSGYYDAGSYPGWTTDGFGTVQPVIS